MTDFLKRDVVIRFLNEGGKLVCELHPAISTVFDKDGRDIGVVHGNTVKTLRLKGEIVKVRETDQTVTFMR